MKGGRGMVEGRKEGKRERLKEGREVVERRKRNG